VDVNCFVWAYYPVPSFAFERRRFTFKILPSGEKDFYDVSLVDGYNVP
jgi:hypothetical protein